MRVPTTKDYSFLRFTKVQSLTMSSGSFSSIDLGRINFISMDNTVAKLNQLTISAFTLKPAFTAAGARMLADATYLTGRPNQIVSVIGVKEKSDATVT